MVEIHCINYANLLLSLTYCGLGAWCGYGGIEFNS